MGKKIDRFILSAAGAAAFYLYYQKAFSNRMVSLLLAMISFIVLRKTISLFSGVFSRFGWLERRRRRRQAGGAILTLALLPEEEAQKKLAGLISRCYGEEHKPVVIQNHPSTALSINQVFTAWKQQRGQVKLVICATSPADAACRSFACSLKSPKTAIIDADMLSRMIAEHPEGFCFEKGSARRIRLKLQHIAALFFNRRNAPRCFAVSICMLLISLITGQLPYLFSSLFLLAAAFACLKQAVRPAHLF